MGIVQTYRNALEWTEPVCVKRVERGRRIIPRWFHVFAAAIAIAITVTFWLSFKGGGDPLWAQLIAGPIIAGLLYLLPMVNGTTGATVWVNKGGITRFDHPVVLHIHGLMALRIGVLAIPWSSVSWAALVDRATLGGYDMRVLEIYGEGDALLARIGVLLDEEPTSEKLVESFAYNGGKTLARVAQAEQGAVP